MYSKIKENPEEAIQALNLIRELLEDQLVGVYLYGSAVMGGLRPDSDVDILVLTNSSLSESIRSELTKRLMQISGKPGESTGIRPLEVTIVNHKDIVPWHFPPKYEFMYGEWLRALFEKGDVPGATTDPDLALLLAQLERNSVNLFGPTAEEVLDPIPWVDIQRAMRDSLPGLIASLKGDERNVILNLARMWFTASTSEFSSKDRAAAWAIPQLPDEHAALLDRARRAYLGEDIDNWDGKQSEVTSLIDYMEKSIEPLLSI
jgi:streptomycin 3"-adenylyltransferase